MGSAGLPQLHSFIACIALLRSTVSGTVWVRAGLRAQSVLVFPTSAVWFCEHGSAAERHPAMWTGAIGTQ